MRPFCQASFLAILVAAGLLTVSECSSEDVHRLSLHRKKTDPKQQVQIFKELRNKAKTDRLLSNKVAANDDTIDVMLIRSINVVFYANITIGTPPQTFQVYIRSFDTFFWVPSSECTEGACNMHKKYNSSASSSFQKDGRPSNVDLNQGHLSSDTVCMTGVCNVGTIFTEATWMHSIYTFDSMGGVLGFGRYSNTSQGVEPFFYALIKQKKLRPFFSLWINGTYDYDNDDVLGAELTFGGFDKNRFDGDIFWVPLLPSDFWSLQMNSISVNSHAVACVNGCQPVVSISAQYIIGPPEQIRALHEKIGKFHEIDDDPFYTYSIENCTSEIIESLQSVSFDINGKTFTMEPKYFVKIDRYNRSNCVSLLMGLQVEEVVWTLGSSFMAKYYTIFNLENNSMGFARSREQ